MSKIEWTDKTWNVITGCTQISPACENCYAKAMTKRLQGMAHSYFKEQFPKESVLRFNDNGTINDLVFNGEPRALYPQSKAKLKYIQGWNKVAFHKESLNDILDTKKYPKGSKIFVNSMSDTFHKDVSEQDITEMFYAMSKRQNLTFQVLTKRAERMYRYFDWYVPQYVLGGFADYFYEVMSNHIWFGVTAENQKYADERIPYLIKLKELLGVTIFVSIEPMLEHMDLSDYIDELDWVIVGGEKVPNNKKKARSMESYWVDNIHYQCQKNGVPFFFKQWGSRPLLSLNSDISTLESCKEFPREQ